jgi:hypothetical protein
MPPRTHAEPRTLSDALRLVPVVELLPFRYDPVGPPVPDDNGPEARAAWERIWNLTLADVGIPVEPLEPSSSLVPVSRLTDPGVLRRLLQVTLRSFDSRARPADPLARVYPLEGGQALLDGEDVILTPRSSADLTGLRSWENAARRQVRGFHGFWMGEPQVAAHWEDPWLVLREDAPDRNGVRRAYRLSPLALERAVHSARREQQDFVHRLVPVLSERFPEGLAQALAWKLGGLEAPGNATVD